MALLGKEIMTYSKLLNIPLTTSSNRVAIAASKALHQVKNLDWEFKAELKWGATDNWQLDANNNFALHVRQMVTIFFPGMDLLILSIK